MPAARRRWPATSSTRRCCCCWPSAPASPAPSCARSSRLGDGSMALAMDDVAGVPTRLAGVPKRSTPELLDAVWHEVARLAPRRARPSGAARRRTSSSATTVDRCSSTSGAGAAAASARLQAIDRAELLASLAALVGAQDSVASAVRVLDRDDLVAAASLSAAAGPVARPPARATSEVAAARSPRTASPRAPAPSRCRSSSCPRAPADAVMIATLTGAFYVLLPQLANVDDSIRALRSANWLWLAGALVMSALTYVFSAVGLLGGVRDAIAVRDHRRGLGGLVVRQPGHAGQRRRHGAQRALHAEGRRATGRSGDRHGPQRGRRWHRARRAARAASSRGPGQSSSTCVLGTGRQQAARGDRRRARRRRRGDRHAAGAPPRALTGGAGAASVRSPGWCHWPARRPGSPCSSAARSASRSPTSRRSPARWRRSTAAPASPRSARSTSARRSSPPPHRRPAASARSRPRSSPGSPASGIDPAIAVAAVLSYRLVTYWLPILPGWLSFRRLDRRGYI